MTAEEYKAKLRWLDRHLGNKTLESIDRDMIERIARVKQKDGCSNATVNRTLALVRAMLRKCAREWQWLDRAPVVRMLKEPTRRVRYLTHAEADRLLAELPTHLRDMAAFSLESGLRAANVTGLKWSVVDLKRKMAWVHLSRPITWRRGQSVWPGFATTVAQIRHNLRIYQHDEGGKRANCLPPFEFLVGPE